MIRYHIIYDLSKVWMISIFRVILWKRDLYIITTETTDYLITDAPPGPRIIKRCARSSDRLHSYHLSYDYTQLTTQIIVLLSYNSIVKTTQVSDCFKGIKFRLCGYHAEHWFLRSYQWKNDVFQFVYIASDPSFLRWSLL